jgi:FkbM family methyltransferase
VRFISYAQNFEDVILWRALKRVERGFYIDVGAASPEVDSVTKAFYERGWRGINIEPHPDLFEELVRARSADINLDVALGERPGIATMVIAEHAPLSTLDADSATALQRARMPTSRREVSVRTLESVWRDHVPPGQDVHFLKIDVEGSERRVLEGGAWHADRPWLVLVEATRPQTSESTHDAWEGVLTRSGYEMVYADGLNRFYVAAEHRDLSPAFAFPPNVFDDFIRVAEVRAEERALDAGDRAARAERELASVYRSRSWRITAPLRAASRRLFHRR